MEAYLNLTLAAILGIAVVTDLKSQRIPNWLTYPAMLIALVYHGMTQGLEGLMFSGLGLALGLGVMILPFLIGVMGAGDVKLMAAAGAFLGAAVTFKAFLFTSILGGVYALIVLARHREALGRIVTQITASATRFAATRELAYAPQTTALQLPRLCYGVAIAGGTLASMALTYGSAGFIPPGL